MVLSETSILNILDNKFYSWVDMEEDKIHEMIFVNLIMMYFVVIKSNVCDS